MITDLSIQNIAVIDKLDLEIGVGMSVLTGETGAGKSIIIDAINLILGARANKSLIRHGEKKACVQAVFRVCDTVVTKLFELGIEVEDGQIIVTRQITDDGKSVCRINGTVVPASLLRELSLIDVHGQHDNQALLTPSKHGVFVDSYARNKPCQTQYLELYRKCRQLDEEIQALRIDEKERLSQIDLLTYQVDEIEAAKLMVGEDKELTAQLNLVSNAEKVKSALEKSYDVIYEMESSTYDTLSAAQKELGRVCEVQIRIDEVAKRVSEMLYTVEDCSHEIHDLIGEVDFDETALDEIQRRLDIIFKLKRKYGSTIEEIIKFGKQSKQKLLLLEDNNGQRIKLEQELKEYTGKLTTVGEQLYKTRQNAGQELEEKIEHMLTQLDMPKVRFKVDITHTSEFFDDGMDTIEFLISANPGEPPKSLAQIASGGELSRVMLAIKSILADSDEVDTLIFDEIDTGVSGNAAKKIATALSNIADKRQVICISHLPQITAWADHQYVIEKDVSDERVTTKITEVLGEMRERALAVMMDGNNVTQTTLMHVKQMLADAKDEKRRNS